MHKALALPRGASATPVSAGYLQQLSQQPRRDIAVSQGDLLPRDTTPAEFGPGMPLVPSPVDVAGPSGRPAPRRYDYPVGYNQDIESGRVAFTTLRKIADVSIVRQCIEARKSAISGLAWSFTIDSTRASRLAEAAGTSRFAASSELRKQHADTIDRLQQFWSRPDRINGWTWSEWVAGVIEEQLVIDAPSIYPHPAMNGDLHSFELLDGATIKPLLDHRGATPQPPNAAYQQILKGFPRGDYRPSPSGQFDSAYASAIYGPVPSGKDGRTDCLIYRPRNRRTDSPYGRSNTESALADVDLWLRRVDWLRAEYAAGVTPEMIINTDTSFSPDQLYHYEQVFNDELAGRTAERHRAKLLPKGFKSEFPPGMDSKFSPDLDLHVIRLICNNFYVLPSSMGFVPTSGLGGKGHQDGESDSEMTRGTKPTAEWIKDLVNELSRVWLGMPPEVTFTFNGLDDEDEERQNTILISRVQAGLKTPNEGRDELNLTRYPFPAADKPMVFGGIAPTLLDPDERPPPPPAIAPGGHNGPPPPHGENEKPGEKEQVKPGEPAPADEDDDGGRATSPANTAANRGANANANESRKSANRAEAKAFAVFARGRAGGNRWRDFAFNTYPDHVALAVNALGRAGDIDTAKAVLASAVDTEE